MVSFFTFYKQNRQRKLFLVIFFFFLPNFLNSEVELFLPQQDLGTIAHNEKIKAFFFLRNTENIFVRIKKIETSCGCISITEKKEWLTTNQKIPFHVLIIPDPNKLGQNSWFIRIYTSSVQTPMILITYNSVVLQNDIVSIRKIELTKKFAEKEDAFVLWVKREPEQEISISQKFGILEKVFRIECEEKICEVLYPGTQVAVCFTLKLQKRVLEQIKNNEIKNSIKGFIILSIVQKHQQKIDIPISISIIL